MGCTIVESGGQADCLDRLLALGYILSHLFSSFVMLGKLLNLSVPQVCHSV